MNKKLFIKSLISASCLCILGVINIQQIITVTATEQAATTEPPATDKSNEIINTEESNQTNLENQQEETKKYDIEKKDDIEKEDKEKEDKEKDDVEKKEDKEKEDKEKEDKEKEKKYNDISSTEDKIKKLQDADKNATEIERKNPDISSKSTEDIKKIVKEKKENIKNIDKDNSDKKENNERKEVVSLINDVNKLKSNSDNLIQNYAEVTKQLTTLIANQNKHEQEKNAENKLKQEEIEKNAAEQAEKLKDAFKSLIETTITGDNTNSSYAINDISKSVEALAEDIKSMNYKLNKLLSKTENISYYPTPIPDNFFVSSKENYDDNKEIPRNVEYMVKKILDDLNEDFLYDYALSHNEPNTDDVSVYRD